MISGIYHMANGEPPTGEEADRRNQEAFKRAWQMMGLIVIYPDSVTDDWTRQAFINEAEARYGKRRGNK